MSGFPEGFLFGAATSAYQIEGSPLADGACPSNWHRWAHTPGKIANGDTGDVACDHYRRWREDVELLREMGLGAYRFSISWSRVMPRRRSGVNQRGLDFYARLVDALLEAGIVPMITLYHWDLPAALEDAGGWLNPDIRGWFADYADVVFRELADRVPLWATINEPWVVMDAAYLYGLHPPGHKSPRDAAVAAHNLLCAHGAGVQVYRGHGRGKIGLVVNIEPKHPATDATADAEAAARGDVYMNRQFIEPVLTGAYPERLAEVFGSAWPEHSAEDMKLIATPIDFVGINYYTRSLTRHDDGVVLTRASSVRNPGAFYTTTGWEVYPDGLREVLVGVTKRYGRVPLYVTENGCALDDAEPGPDGVIDDPVRVEYFRSHLAAVRAAIAEGADVRGYFAWSLFDNLEWHNGFEKRFGLVAVEPAGRGRVWKRSGRSYITHFRSVGV